MKIEFETKEECIKRGGHFYVLGEKPKKNKVEGIYLLPVWIPPEEINNRFCSLCGIEENKIIESWQDIEQEKDLNIFICEKDCENHTGGHYWNNYDSSQAVNKYGVINHVSAFSVMLDDKLIRYRKCAMCGKLQKFIPEKWEESR